jgi:N-acetylglucosaminyl-diphospho-decaprenol L-rhamnosyltransferase
MNLRLSIIIVTYKSENVITQCLSSIQPVDGIEIIVIDNASPDSTVAIINDKFPQIKSVGNKKNIGFAAAANQGFKISSAPIVLFLNPDTELNSGFVESLLVRFNNDPSLSIVGSRLINADGSTQPSCWKRFSLLTLFLESFLPYAVSLPLVTVIPKRFEEVEIVSGACMAVRREVFKKVGMFDTRFFMYYEDADFCLRAITAGYKIFYNPDTKVIHHQWKSSESSTDVFFSHIFESKLSFYKRHFSGIKYILASLIIYSSLLFKTPLYFLVGILLFKNKYISLSKSYLVAFINILKK